jgi:hypothetical protein
MYSILSFPASSVDADELNAIMADYLALERIRVFRRLLVKRFAILTVIVAAVSLSWLSRLAVGFSVSLCLTPPAWAWVVEIRRERRLDGRLKGVSARKVVKSS